MDTNTSFAWTFFVCFIDVKRVRCFHFSQLQVADKAGEGIKLQVSSAWSSLYVLLLVPFVNLMETFNDLTCFVTGAQLSSSFRKAAILNYVHPKLASLLYVIQVHFWWLLSHRERKRRYCRGRVVKKAKQGWHGRVGKNASVLRPCLVPFP